VKIPVLVLADTHGPGKFIDLLGLITLGLNESEDSLGKTIGRHSMPPLPASGRSMDARPDTKVTVI
jgi:hypothetical protein